MMTTLCTRCPTALIALLATGLLVVENAHAQGTVDSDFAALVALYGATDGASWTYSDNWVTLEPLGEWHGVITDSSGRVTEVRLGGNQLMGEIPSELGNLDELTGLFLDQNQLMGAIPSELGNLSNLQNLYLYQNELTGAIPSELGDLSNLQELYLYQNQLTGAIPSELGDLSNLQKLYLYQNQLTGAIPSELGKLSNLQRLLLYQNELTGKIPPELGNLANLQNLYLSQNELTGAIPSELGNLSNLQFLYLFKNELSGAIPSELGKLSNLQRLHLYENELTGAIPSELANLGNLLTLNLKDNELTGEIPLELGNLDSLTGLFLDRNQLMGEIPSELGDLRNLQNLDLFSNELSGAIPPELEKLTQLQVFDIRNTGLCVPPGSQLHTWLATITFRGAVCAPPTVTSVVVASAPQSGDTYRSYETIVFTVTFNEPVRVTPGRLRLEVGLDNPGGASGSTVEAVFSGQSKSERPTADTPQVSVSRHLHFEYKVQLFDRDEDGVRIRANALRLASGARIQGEVGADAELDHAALGTQSDHKVDGTADVPMIRGIEVVSTPRLSSKGTTNSDTYGEGETIRIEVRFDQPVVVEGEPTFALEVGNPCRAVCEADYESGSGTDTLVFAYLVLEVDVDRNGIAIRGNPIEVVSGDSIRNAADQDAHLSSKGKGTKGGHKVDGSRAAPSHLSVENAEAHEADGEMEFTVRLEPHGLGIVTVDYATADGTGSKAARAGSDYTETSGTLTFNPLETERTVSVPITDDAHEDDGETFTLTLSNADGAKIRGDDGEATGTIRNSEIQPLTATFEDVPAAHDGSAFTFRMAFSEDIGISYRSLREDALAVTGGRVTGGKRVDGRRDLFEMTVEPDGAGDVTIELPAGRECGVSGAICTKGENRRQLTNSPSATVAGPPDEAPAGLTATFEGLPAEHRGEGGFHFRVAFSEDIGISFRALREDAFTVTGGRVTGGTRVDGRRDLFRMTVRPDSGAGVTITLPAGRACGVSGAICTKGEPRRPLTNSPSATVAGPVGIAVADARVEEGAGALLAFAVTLSRAASGTLTVNYATSDGTATAGTDYTAASGTLTFQTGESSQTIEVTVLDDAHDEGEETLTLTLSNPLSGRVTHAEATGTIENHDPLPRALLARFGRTAAVHVVEHVEERLAAPREPGFRGRFAGRELRRGMERDIALNFLRQLGGTAGAGPLGAGAGGPLSGAPAAGAAPLGMPGPAGGGGHLAAAGPMGGAALMGGASGSMGMAAGPMGGAAGPDGRFDGGGLLRMGLGGGDVLTGSDFALGRETGHGGILSFWSRGAQSRFAGREGALSLGGDVRTTMFGADYAKGPLVTGLSLSHSRGLGEYAGVAGGQVASSVTGLYPWLGYQATERVTVWGVAGYGAGGLRLTPQGGPALESGLSMAMAMAAAGTRGELVAGGSGGFALAFKADALWVGTSIDGVDGAAGRLKATAAAVTRFRTGLEGSRAYTLAGRLSLTPSVEVGLRHDGGDAETGAGLDVGGGLVMADASTGLAVDLRVRMLVMHQAEGFRERGVALSLSYNPTPSTPLGFVARVAPSWGGQATSGAEALWGQETMGEMTHGGLASGNRLDGEVGYGLPVGRRFVGTPTLGVGTSADGRDYRLGYRLGALGGAGTAFELGVEAHRRESPMLDTADNGFLGRATVGW